MKKKIRETAEEILQEYTPCYSEADEDCLVNMLNRLASDVAREIFAEIEEEINRIGGHNLCEWETIGVKALIDRQPTPDVVEVVRCKDCKHWVKGGYDPIICRDFGSCTCEYWEHPSEYYETNGNDFCSNGERSEGNDT